MLPLTCSSPSQPRYCLLARYIQEARQECPGPASPCKFPTDAEACQSRPSGQVSHIKSTFLEPDLFRGGVSAKETEFVQVTSSHKVMEA